MVASVLDVQVESEETGYTVVTQSIIGGISVDGSQEDQHFESSTQETVKQSFKLSALDKRVRPTSLTGKNTRIQTGHSRMYVTVNADPDDPTKIFEVFAWISKTDRVKQDDEQDGERQQCERVWLEAVCRLLSVSLQHGVPQAALIDQLINLECVKVRDGELGTWVKSPADGIAQVMEGFNGSEDR